MSRIESVNVVDSQSVEAGPSVNPARYSRALKFDPVQTGLPLAIESQCLECEKVLAATMIERDGAIVIEKECPDHGAMLEVLHDVLFSDVSADHLDSPDFTYTGSRIRPVVKYLPKTVETLCPECARNIIGRVFDWNGDVYMEKTCPDHGYVRDKVFTNTELYLKCQQWGFRDGRGQTDPKVKNATHCPTDCGLCNQHQSDNLLGNIDLTNRCNLKCPVCFANANVTGYVYEPEFDDIVAMMQQLLDYRPAPTRCIQFSGGEPTLHRDFLKIVRKAREMGFPQVQIASNGIKLADIDFAEACAAAGLHTVYLQFDGVDDHVYEQTRGRKLFDIKCKAIENCHRAGVKIILVPTIVRGVNGDQVAKILHFAIDNIHAVSGIAYQPVAFTGRISLEEREAQRYTLGDLCNDLASTGLADVKEDMYPLTFVSPLSRMVGALTGRPTPSLTNHPNCSAGTYFLVGPNGEAAPLSQAFDAERLFSEMDRIADAMANSRFKFYHKLRLAHLFKA
ncbi:MAG: radical SAM protein [bacterium]